MSKANSNNTDNGEIYSKTLSQDNFDAGELDALLSDVTGNSVNSIGDTVSSVSSGTMASVDGKEEESEESEESESESDDDNIVVIVSSSERAEKGSISKKDDSATDGSDATAAAVALAAAPKQQVVKSGVPEPDESVYEKDLEQYADKPWRRPGADRTDYFNYGFDEETWKAYCSRQMEIRQMQQSLQAGGGHHVNSEHFDDHGRKRQRR